MESASIFVGAAAVLLGAVVAGWFSILVPHLQRPGATASREGDDASRHESSLGHRSGLVDLPRSTRRAPDLLPLMCHSMRENHLKPTVTVSKNS